MKELAKAALALAGLGTPKPFEIAYAVNPGKTDWVLHDGMIAVKQGEKVMYYGDWEITAKGRKE